MDPDHQRYWRGWRLCLERGWPYEKVREMSLDDVDLENLLIDRVADAHARARAKRREREHGGFE